MRLMRHIHTLTRPGLNMGAMIDVVFLLLIFFMCTTSFQPTESGLSAQLPQVGGAVREPQDYEPIWIRLAGDAETVHIVCDRRACADFDALAEELRLRRAIADIPVVLAGQDRIPFAAIVRAMDLCYEVGFSRVAFAARGD
ncbi:MAG: biopolymer transporter ExbD [Sedimentisphaerales bacterium]|nr:biopolymer transporter ExbD [Sedimentisphaerales bacterium]